MGTFTSKLGYHLQTKSLISLSTQTFLLTSPNALKALTEQTPRSHVEPVGRYATTPSLGRMCSMFTIFSNCSIILPGFKFTELHDLTLAARSYVLLTACMSPKLLLGTATCDLGWYT